MKKALTLTLASVLAVGLVACSTPASSSTPAPAASSSAPASSSAVSSSVSASTAASDSTAAEMVATGAVSALTEEGFTLTTTDGKTLDFVVDAANTVEGKDALVDGATVTVTFTGDEASEDAATRVLMSVTAAEAEADASGSTSGSASASTSGSASTAK